MRICPAPMLLLILFPWASLFSAADEPLRTGQSAMEDWTTDAPGVRRVITVADMPPPYSTPSVDNGPRLVGRPKDAALHVPPGFVVDQLATGLGNPRKIIAAPNGDLFVAESAPGRVKILRPGADGKIVSTTVFARDLHQPFGIAFYPPGPNAQFVYVADTDAVLRFAYQNGDLTARSTPEMIVPDIPGGGRLRKWGRTLDARRRLQPRWKKDVRLGGVAFQRQ